jgi:hypothetical protein
MSAEQSAKTERKGSAAYLPFATFLSALDDLAKISIPNKIERATFPGKSGQDQSQLISVFKFFDLIEDDGTPKPPLSDLVHKQDERKDLIKRLLETHYPDIVALDFAKITPSQLETALTSPRYGVQGETRKKAKTFLLKAAQYAGFTVHPLLTKITRNRSRAAAGRSNAGNSAATATATDGGASGQAAPIRQDEPTGSDKTIQLRRGGSLSLSLSVNLWELKGEDRKFVFDLIDKIDAYEEASAGSTEDVNKVEKEARE